ncbi:apolipoprotein A1/A4/E family protein [Rhizobium sp. WYCCWR 11146]|uniref:apolipoprotein A1/A4/E family protein n=1 Tax=Rhizobium sp. WYCCWR 11146 TaxID=2749833 RepID=UPI0015E763EA|nr:apolipoprotein A1/A4/E family protein [Rhizobium sp. WYCCWR 11146]MBA1349761.1 apolipoprotein A1/A4/E family protein [Rhizobium sp. WYCCWR 11146]
MVQEIGRYVVGFILSAANILVKDSAAPGIVALGLVILLALCALIFVCKVASQKKAVTWLKAQIQSSPSGAEFSRNIDRLSAAIDEGGRNKYRRHLATVWNKYRETLVPHEENGKIILRNAVRPSMFLNPDDLGFSVGFWRIVPGLFVSSGLFLTFLGLIAALQTLGGRATIDSAAMQELLSVASAKFIMSLTGLFCSIFFTIVLRTAYGRLEEAIHELCGAIEKHLTYISLEALATEQLNATREQREHFRLIGMELVAEIGRPLREELPAAIQSSIADAMAPIVEKVGKMGAEGVGDMVSGLSNKLTDSIGLALSEVSNKISDASDRLGALADRLDQSSGRIGSEMEGVTERVARAVEDLRTALMNTAEVTGGTFNEGAEKLLSVMNQTLEGIRDNTGEGARAMSAAAEDMRQAAASFKQEIEAATRVGTETAQERMKLASQQVSDSIGNAGKDVAEVFSRTSAEIAKVAEDVSQKAGAGLLAPLAEIGTRLESLVKQLDQGTSDMRRMSDGVKTGAEASERAAASFKGAAAELVTAASPVKSIVDRMDNSIRQLTDSTQHVASTISRSAEATAESAASALAAAGEILGSEAKAIESALGSVTTMLEKLRGQGDRLDDMDVKLGQAFNLYTENVEKAVQGMFGHVRDLQDRLNPALDTMRDIVEQAEQFAPQSRRA